MRVVVGISGGVDSTIAAYILKKEGHEVIGKHFDFLNLPEFKDIVIKYFVDEYKNGRTPNPCAYCNGNMKFKMLYDAMLEEKADMIATGHYANVGVSDGRYFIKKSANAKKDQSYMLYTLTQEQLSHLYLPIGDMDKEKVREIARELNLDVAEKKDSQDICFITCADRPDSRTGSPVGDRSPQGSQYSNVGDYIKAYDFGEDYKEKIARGVLSIEEMNSRPYLKKGEFVDKDGKVLGYHEGIINYTIGQRKGLNIAFGERKFVLSIDANKNQVVLGDNDDLMSSDFKIKDIIYQKWSKDMIVEKSNAVLPIAKVRYRHDGTPCEVKIENNIISCHMTEKVRAITSGQAAVFYDNEGDILFGGTII